MATGGSAAHTLALDYGLRSVLASLGAPQVLGSLYVLDSQIAWSAEQGLQLAVEVERRFQEGLRQLLQSLDRPARATRQRAHAEPAPLIAASG